MWNSRVSDCWSLCELVFNMSSSQLQKYLKNIMILLCICVHRAQILQIKNISSVKFELYLCVSILSREKVSNSSFKKPI